ncbi:MAG: hypothetical protein H0W70_11790 [Actinobacteria bacterium]|nr:hypothetical protein [Actinomycetota bacterium]
MKRVAALGGVAALTYIGAVVATAVWGGAPVRPLFDAVGPAPAYRWVRPPPDFAAGNVKPKATTVAIGLNPDDLPPAGASEDSQFVFNLPAGAIAVRGTEDKASAEIVPVDPDTLGPLPTGKFSNGNAYSITFRYEPSREPAPVSSTGSVLLTVPVPGDGVLVSKDGKTWIAVKAQHASATAVEAELPDSGYYLAVTPDAVGFGAKGGGITRLVVPMLITVLAAAALLMTPVLLRRRDRRGR